MASDGMNSGGRKKVLLQLSTFRGPVRGMQTAPCLSSSGWAMFPQTMYPDLETDLYKTRFLLLSCALWPLSTWSMPINRCIRPTRDSRFLATAGNVFLAFDKSIPTATSVILSTP